MGNKAFEKWAKGEGYPLHLNADGKYGHPMTQCVFKVWDACDETHKTLLEQRAILLARLDLERRQFQEIRLYTQDGDLACVCATHETDIAELIESLTV